MSAPFSAVTVAQRFVQSVLTGSAAVTTELSASAIYPNLAPSPITGRHLVHSFGGPNGGRAAEPMRAPIASVGLFWDVTAWEPGWSQQALEPLMEAVMGALIGADTRGKTHRYVDGSRAWNVDADYAGPEAVPLDLAPSGVWAPLRERYRLTLRPAS